MKMRPGEILIDKLDSIEDFVYPIGPIFQISLIFAFIGCP